MKVISIKFDVTRKISIFKEIQKKKRKKKKPRNSADKQK